MAGNMAGDFYKGKIEKFSELPPEVQKGIRLHRFIDETTDGSEEMKQATRLFQLEGIRRVGSVAGDILLDHFISKNWSDYSAVEYQTFIAFIYEHTEYHREHLSPQFFFMYQRLKRYDWFNYYPSFEGISEILRQFSKRLSFENDLAQSAGVYRFRSKEFDSLFSSFLGNISAKCENFILDNLKSSS